MTDTLVEDVILVRYANPFTENSKHVLDIDYKQVDWKYLLYKSKENKVMLSLIRNLINTNTNIPANKIKTLQLVLKEREKSFQQWIEILILTLDIFKEKKINVILVKSLKGYPHCSVDLDILLKDKKSMRKAADAYKQMGYTIYTTDDSHKLSCQNNLTSIEIDLHSKMAWRNIPLTFFNYEEIWNRKTVTENYGVEIPTPSVEDDVLITCAHSIFGHHRYFLGDLFYLTSVIEGGIDLQYMFNTTKKFGWSLALYSFLCYSNTLYQGLYGSTIISRETLDSVFGKNAFTRYIDTILQKQNQIIHFPFMYPITFELLIAYEKMVQNLRHVNYRDFLEFVKKGSIFMFDNVRMRLSFIYDSLGSREYGGMQLES